MKGGSFWAYRGALFCLSAAGFAALFDYLFIWHLPGIGAFAFVALLEAVLLALARAFGRKLPADALALLALALFFSSMLAVRASPLLALLDIASAALTLMLATETIVRGSLRDFKPEEYVRTFLLPLAYIQRAFDSVVSIRLPRFGSFDSQSKQIVRGVIIAIPLLLVFVALFSAADPVFDRFFSGLLNLDIALPDHPGIIAAAFVFICGAYAYSFSEESKIRSSASAPKRPLGTIETSIILGSVNALFFLFIALQAGYFFGGAANIGADAYTYSEYARKGFFELIAIASLALLILLVVEKFIERTVERHLAPFKYLSAMMAVQVMVLMALAFNRLSLYESAYGFTTLRLYSHAFILLLALVYCILLHKIFIDGRESRFGLRVFVALVAFVTVMNFLNPDAFIASRNIERYYATGKIDTEYLSELSSDAGAQKIAAMRIPDPDHPAALVAGLYWDWQSYRYGDGTDALDWRSWNLSRESMRQLVLQNGDEISAAYYNKGAATVRN